MKEQLDEESQRALVAYRCQRSAETMREAEVMFREKFYNAAVNRLYYACYYAVSALLLQKGIQANTHKGVKTMFALHVVTTGEMAEDIAIAYFTLFEKRHSSDYDDFVFFNRSATLELINQAHLFIEATIKIVQENSKENHSQ